MVHSFGLGFRYGFSRFGVSCSGFLRFGVSGKGVGGSEFPGSGFRVQGF